MSIDLRPGATALESPKPVPMAPEVASRWTAISSALTQTQAVQNASIPPESWTGAAADAASSEIQALGGKLSDLAGAFPGPANSLKTWEDRNNQGIQTIEGLQQQWDDAITTYKQRMAEIKAQADSDKEYNPAPDRKAARDTLSSAQAPLKKSYNDEIHQLDEAAKKAATAIQKASDDKISPDAVKGGRAAVGAALFGSDMPICDGAAEWDYARDVAPEMLDDLDKAANSKEQLTEAQVKALQDKWGKDLQNPFCVQAMADAYRAKHGKDANFSDMLNRLAVNTAGPAYIPNESERATRASFTERIGTAMVLSTGGINASGAEGLGRSETYALMKDRLFGQDGSTKISQIETSNIADIKASFDTIYNREPGTGWQIRGYDIYSQATGYAAGKNPDLAYSGTAYEGGDNSLAAKLVTYDHDYQRGLETKRVMDDAVSWPIVNHTTKDQDLFNQVKDPLQSLYLLSDTPDSMQGADFTTSHPGLEKLEQERLKSVRGFLNQSTSFEVEDDWDRNGKDSSEKIPMVRYLTGSRNYGGKEFRGFSDGGDAFGTMIEDATRPLDEDQKSLLGDDWKKASNAQARIVGNYAAGYQDGLDHDGAKKGAEDAFGAENSKLRSHTGVILGNWAESLASMDGDSAGGSSLKAGETVGEGRMSPTTGQAQFTLSPKLRDAIYAKGGLFTDLGFDNPKQIAGQDTDNPFDDKFEGGRPPALSAVQAGAYAGYKHDLAQAMAGDYHVDTSDTTPGSTWSQNVTDRVNKWGGLFEHLDAATADVKGLNYDRIAERNQLIRQGIDAVSSAVPYDALPGGKIVESLASAAVDGAKNKVLDEFLPTDFKSEKLNDAVNSHYAANEQVADTLAETYASGDQWANSEDKSKQELVSQFLKEEAVHSDGVKAQSDGDLPSYNSMSETQQVRFRAFLKEHTYLKAPLEAADKTTWDSFTKLRLTQQD